MTRSSQIENLKQRIHDFGSQFYIQPGYVKSVYSGKNEVETFREVFPAIFSENEESAYIFWKQIPIRFHYTYECYANIDTLLNWFEMLSNKSSGSHDLVLQTDVFIVELHTKWADDRLKIEPLWRVKTSHQLLADRLNELGAVVTKVKDFLGEWKLILVQLVRAVERSKITITLPAEREKIMRIKRLTPGVQTDPKLYKP